MALAAVGYMAVVLAFVPGAEGVLPDIRLGFAVLWQPWALLLVQGFWFMAFLYTGRSVVTGSSITFHVIQEKV
jgi:hypothetical protein